MEEQTDFLIIGSGISGLSFALKAARLGRVTLVTKKKRLDTATNLAQGGIAAVLSPEDSFAAHIADTLTAGAGLCHQEVVEMVVETGPTRVRELMAMGVAFQQGSKPGEELDLGREGGHSARRIAHTMDRTGSSIEESLLQQAAAEPNITILENHLAVDLLLASKAENKGVSGSKSAADPSGAPFFDRCLGAYVLNRQSGKVETWQARVTVLCTGGTGKVYLYTTNPDIATGDGIAMAYRAGARVANLEFVQFHPTCLYHPRVKNFLISEAVRGEGGRLVDGRGRPFMGKYDPRGDLATRDAVARAIDLEMKTSGEDCVFLDISHQPADFLKTRFPTIYQTCLNLGIDITREPIPVVPAAHYMCGGVITDLMGRTDLENLYALGETACTGLHGANRLASNSLLEAVVFAHQAARQCQADWPQLTTQTFPAIRPWRADRARPIEEAVLISHNWDQIRRLMWNYVGIVRSEKRLHLIREQLGPILAEVESHYQDYLLTPDLVELRNIALVAQLIVRCAISRKESRGLHYISDYPRPDDQQWKKDTIIGRN
ncbi:L-aspartate oxidase [Desulfurivibrio alkaliphilus]|uniref:L-aspartate oxidase n=1 Tax=Desulfurivibrio alkaliphilus (strain DSM 19089 / UNIQEM U267 / AHT2) TaxID=589865 RepID=D6Z5H7_DESAT|nr:L-aspartate oxidase [Desulfurivibrio alkaliphilus]ADH86714.1 L-aspartate oxidase [Desulfurivibrio alkaliphilus AHT 2]